jgi:hypothetical protein
VLSPGPGFEDTWSPRGTRAVAALIKYQDRGYKFVQGVEEDNTEQVRLWNDALSLRMRLYARRSIGKVGPNLRWELGGREITGGWAYDYEPIVQVAEGGVIMCYENRSGPVVRRQ